jgi:hypothetical protein
MAETTTPFRNIKEDASRAIDRVKVEADEFVDALDFPEMSRRIQEFGRQKPIALALAALTIGIAAGMLVRNRISGT